MATLRRMTLPEPVTLTRFDMALCVFSFCFITLLSVLAGQSNTFNKKLRFSLCEREAHKGKAVYGVIVEFQSTTTGATISGTHLTNTLLATQESCKVVIESLLG